MIPKKPGEDLSIELIVWFHTRRTRRQPYSAAAYLIDLNLPTARQTIEGGMCLESDSEAEAAREALRDLQERLEGQHAPILIRALKNPTESITKRREV
jgi:hypothetical protein